MIAMLLAAGHGERMRPITETIPKALVEVRGRSLIERHLDALAEFGITRVVINLGWLGEQIADRIGSGSAYGVNVVYSPEGDNVLETGGGIHRALPLLGSQPFLVINADVYMRMRLPPASLAEGDMGHLVLVPTPSHKTHGDFNLRDGRVLENDDPKLTFSGVAIYRPEFFSDCEPGRFPLAPLLKQSARAGTLGGSLFEGTWEDVGTPERLAELNRS